jgi:PIN domain nuclease of toxin-antitoxin system
MRLLADTCTFLWWAIDAPELSPRSRELFAHPDNEVYLSAVSCWEIAVKHSLGRLPLPEPPALFVPERRARYGLLSLPLEEEASLYEPKLPRLHPDPFDRMLICQAIVHGLAILTPDQSISQYPVRVLW